MKIRGFEKVSRTEYDKHDLDLSYDALELPKRGSDKSAGYDFVSTKSFALEPGESIKIPSGIKAYMQDIEWLMCAPRSSVGFKYEIQFANIPPVIDADYYGNESNEGHIMFKMVNRGTKVWEVKAGDRIVQGLFLPYMLADGDNLNKGLSRSGGIGSTDCGLTRKLDFDGDGILVPPSINTALITEYIDITLGNITEVKEEDIPNLKKGDFIIGVEDVGKKRYVSGMVLDTPKVYEGNNYSISILANDEHNGYRQHGVNSKDGIIFKIARAGIKSTEFLAMADEALNR